MKFNSSTRLALSLILVLLFIPTAIAARAEEPANESFQSTWDRTDKPVADGDVSRTWMWGDGAFSIAKSEQYAGAQIEFPGMALAGQRRVQYFDKSRMEITDPNADPTAPWYVTNGLLVMELITGEMQVGDDSFEQRLPAEVNVAGDYDDPEGPTYASFSLHLDDGATNQKSTIVRTIDREGLISNDTDFAAYSVGTTHLVEETGHWIAIPFWEFMNSSGLVYEDGAPTTAPLFSSPFYATGFPVTDAYWANVKVADLYTDVLIQCFERRCLTYTPSNDPAWKVEAGNVGQHYYSWRYGWGLAVGPGGYELTSSLGAQRLLGDPYGVARAPDNTILVADSSAGQVLRFDTAGQLMQKIGEPGTDIDQFIAPQGVAVDAAGNIYVTDSERDRVVKFASDGRFLLAWGTTGYDSGQFSAVRGIAIGPDDRVYVVDSFNYRIQIFDDQGNFLSQWGNTGSAADGFTYPDYPLEIAIGPDGTVYVTVYVVYEQHGRVDRFTLDGTYLGAWNFSSDLSGGMTVDGGGTVYVADSATGQIARIASDGQELPAWDLLSPSEPGKSLDLEGIALDSEGRLYVADRAGHRLLVLDPSGNRIAEWSRPGLIEPAAVVANVDGTYFVADPGNQSIIRIDATDAIINNFEVDDLYSLDDMTSDAKGNLLLLEGTNLLRYSPEGAHLQTIDLLTAANAVSEFELDPLALTVDPATGDIFVLSLGSNAPHHDHPARVYRFSSEGVFEARWEISKLGGNDPYAPDPFGWGLAFSDGVLYATIRAEGIATYTPDGTELNRIFGLISRGFAIGSDGSLWLNREIEAPNGDREYHAQQIDPDTGAILRDVELDTNFAAFRADPFVGLDITIDPATADILVVRPGEPEILVYSLDTNGADTSHSSFSPGTQQRRAVQAGQ